MYTLGGNAVDVTFTLGVSELNGDIGTVSEIKVYFTNSDQFETAGAIKSAENLVSLTSAVSVPALTVGNTDLLSNQQVSLTIDGANCLSYTHICAVLSTTDADASNNDACAEFGTLSTGDAVCAGTFCLTQS